MTLEDLPDEPNIYHAFDLDQTATTEAIKKAYRQMALKYHPDKQSSSANDHERQESAEKFIKLSRYYEILSCPARRARYDATGSIQESNEQLDPAFDSWTEYFQSVFNAVTEDSIVAFEKEYRYSESERRDILASYVSTKGHLLQVLDTIMCSSIEDLQRFQRICEVAIEAGEVQSFRGFPHISKKELAKLSKAAKDEAQEVVQMELEEKSSDSLKVAIQKQGQGRMDKLLENIELKYGEDAQNKQKKKPKKKEAAIEPTEQEFEALQAKLFAKPAGTDVARKRKRQPIKEKVIS